MPMKVDLKCLMLPIICANKLKNSKGANNCLSDFIMPKPLGKTDYRVAFALTAVTWEDGLAKEYEDDIDDYNSIMV